MHDGRPLVASIVAPDDTVLAGMNAIEIEHGVSIYRLCITKFGKLILTK